MFISHFPDPRAEDAMVLEGGGAAGDDRGVSQQPCLCSSSFPSPVLSLRSPGNRNGTQGGALAEKEDATNSKLQDEQ